MWLACTLQETKQEKIPEKPASPMDTGSCDTALSRAILPVNVADIDKDDKDNPQLVSEYVNDIYDYLRKLEVCEPCYSLFNIIMQGSS